MAPLHRTILVIISGLLGLSVVHTECGDNGGAGLAWGSQVGADKDGFSTILGSNSTGPFDSAGNPILTVVRFFGHQSRGVLCGQKNPDSYPQTTFGPVLTAPLPHRIQARG
ncbi:hypothetical protein B0H14DRAFT_3899738 [Mycena olivaceomarginata]|nr:hypothetical protein B0H14DRAFT_3899738 [Mycena olivaceomarginata]